MKTNKFSISAVIFLSISLICTIVGFIYYGLTFSVFKFNTDRGLVTCSILAIWLLVVLIATGILDKNQPWYLSFIYVLMPFLLLYSMFQLVSPCITPIGIYFTVSMGDIETNSIGVPRCITGVIFYLVGTISFLVASFFSLRKKGVTIKKEGKYE